MNSPKIDDIEAARHNEFYLWFKAEFQTRYAMNMCRVGHNEHLAQGRYLQGGRWGLVTSSSSGVHLCYKQSPDGSWKPLLIWRIEHASQTTAWRLRRCPYNLRYRLDFWKENKVFICQQAGIESDIRQVANLTLFLNYEIPK